MIVVFWAPSSYSIGGGHSVRSFALAQAVAARGGRSIFLCDSPTMEVMSAKLAQDASVEPVTVDGFHRESLVSICGKLGADWLVLDDYRIDVETETLLRRHAGRLLVVDDFAARRHDCDMLLDTMPYRDPHDYAGLVPSGAILCIGREYTLIRPGIVARRQTSLDRRAKPLLARVLVTFGMTDVRDAIADALSALQQSAIPVSVDVVVGSRDIGDALREWSSSAVPKVEFHFNPSDPAQLFARADLAITAPGVTSLELCTLGVPMLLVETHAHQRALGEYLRESRAALFAGGDCSPKQLAAELTFLSKNPAALSRMSACGAACYDGGGADRVAAMIDELHARPPVASGART